MDETTAGCHGPTRAGTSFLVTGAAGFIGGHLVSRLVQLHGGPNVTALVPVRPDARESARVEQFRMAGVRIVSCDLMELARTRPDLPSFDVVYHLAGYAITEDADGPFEVNSEGTRLLLEWLGPALRGKRMIHTGTLASIDSRRFRGAVNEGTECRPVTPYGITKLEGEKWIASRSVELGYSYTILRLCTIIGRGFRAGGMFGVFPDLLKRQALAVRLNWPGRASFLGVKDLVQILVALPACEAAENRVYVTGTGEQLSFDQLLELMAGILEFRRRRIWLPAFLWRLIFQVAWLGAGAKWLNYEARTFCWRVSHLCGDGLLADASELSQRMKMKFQTVEEALRESYEQQTSKIVKSCG